MLGLFLAPVFAWAQTGPWQYNRHFEVEKAVRMLEADDPAFADPAYDDSAWEAVPRNELPSRAGPYWHRVYITPRRAAPEFDRWSISTHVAGSFELYWDGELIGRSGRVGDSAATEKPGRLDQLFPLPDKIKPGRTYVMAIRSSSYHTGFTTGTYSFRYRIGLYNHQLQRRTLGLAFPLSLGAILAAIGSFFVGMHLFVRGPLHRFVFGLMCLVTMLFIALVTIRWLISYPYSWHHAFLEGRYFTSFAAAWLLGWFSLLFFFGEAKARWLILLTLLLLPGWWWSDSYFGKVAFHFAHGLGFLLVVATIRISRRYPWSWVRVVLIGLSLLVGITLLFLSKRASQDVYLMLLWALIPVLLGMTILDMRRTRRKAHAAALAQARLEAELLRKQLQPHYLLNTLTAISEWIDFDPPTSQRAIHALADEMRLLAHIARQRAVTMREELALCHAHLAIVSLRQDLHWCLQTQNLDEDAIVPPALFHTLLENGVTHFGGKTEGELVFTLTESRDGERRLYTLTGPHDDSLPAQGGATAPVAGTGSHYVQTRLREVFGADWTLAAGPQAHRWVVTLTVPPHALPQLESSS